MLPSNQRIFHVADPDRWTLAGKSGIYLPPGFETDHFIHCCTLEQMPGVLSRYFIGQNTILVLEIEISTLMQFIRFENLDNGSEFFPHLYSSLSVEKVKHQYPLHREENEEFDISFF
jgi:uncharacterized protein (DUF952 family)